MKSKKIVSALLPLAVLGGALPLSDMVLPDYAIEASAEEEYTEGTYGDLTYVNYGDYIEISSCENSAEGELAIPSEIDGVPVTSLGTNAFKYCESLAQITLPSSITNIGSTAFSHCNSLTSITVSENNLHYSSQDGVLFNKDKTELIIYPISHTGKEYTVPNGVTSIGLMAFSYSNLTSIIIPESVEKIGSWAFSFCSNLFSITLPHQVESIALNTFIDCSALSFITILNPNCEIYDSASTLCCSEIYGYENSTAQEYTEKYEKTFISFPTTSTYGDLTYVNYGDYIEISDCDLYAYEIEIPRAIDGIPVKAIGDSAFLDCTYLTSVTIPSSVTKIGNFAFDYCTDLTSVTIPDSVTSIGNYAFNYCISLTSIRIPDSVTTIGTSPFSDCSNLTDIIVSKYNEYYTDVDGVLFDKNMEHLIQYPAGNPRTYYHVPDGVTEIASSTFLNCPNLTYIDIPDSVTTIGIMVFGANSTTIEDNDYTNISNLEYVYIGSGVTSIDSGAFCNCLKLEDITVSDYNENYSSSDGVLFDKDKTELIQYPTGNSRKTYTIPDSVQSMGHFAFEYSVHLNTVIIPDSITRLEYAFFYCPGLTSITIPDSVTYISNAFYNCNSLTSVTIPGSVTYIGSDAFWECSGLKSITITNPDCEIYDSSTTISNGWTDETWDYYFTGTIYGYENSTAQAYAEKYNITFESLGEAPSTLPGDADLSGDVEIADAVKIMCYVTDPENNAMESQGIINGDVYQTGDGLSVQNALSIQKYLAQIITELPES